MTSAMPERRFLPPWTVELDACFVVRDHNGQQLFQVVIETQKVAGPISDAGADVEVSLLGTEPRNRSPCCRINMADLSTTREALTENLDFLLRVSNRLCICIKLGQKIV